MNPPYEFCAQGLCPVLGPRCQAGLLLPKSQKPKQGEVVAAGPGEANVESGQMVPMSVEVGEKAGS